MIGIIFTRNVFAVVVLFALTPWIGAMGLANVHIIMAVVMFAIQLLPLLFLRCGKKARAATARRYQRHTKRNATRRKL